jgi:hypothetical protein
MGSRKKDLNPLRILLDIEDVCTKPVPLPVDLAGYLFLMLVGTGVGVYAMLRAEHLVGQFVEGVAFGQGVLAGPMQLHRQTVGWIDRRGPDQLEPNVAIGSAGPWSEGLGGAQDATIARAAVRHRT